MIVLGFLVGLMVGLLLVGWQRSRSNARIKAILNDLRSSAETSSLDSSFSETSRLGIAIAQQRQIQRDLEYEIETYRQILRIAPVGYLQIDDENRLIWCNSQAQAILAISPESYPAKPRLLLELVRSYELDDLIDQTRNAGQACQSNWTFYPVSSDPSHLFEQQSYALRGYGFPLPDNQVGIFLENRQEAVALLQQRDRWASDLAHEFKTPLTSIRLVAETLQTRVDPALSNWIDRLINETIRLSTLVQDLLELNPSRAHSFRPLQLEAVNLAELLQSVWNSLEPLARKKSLQLNYKGIDPFWAQVDAAQIHRLLVNLLDNSIKYSPSGRTITVQLTIESPTSPDPLHLQQIRLDVIDCGLGFAEKDLPHVFERFYRADPARARPTTLNSVGNPLAEGAQHSGSGLGLAIVRQIVDAHHGSVTAKNHPETGGAWLQVFLPFRPVP